MNRQVSVRFETGQEDRMSDDLGPYDYVQITYGTLRVSKNDDDGDTILANHINGWWVTEDDQKWSDVIIW